MVLIRRVDTSLESAVALLTWLQLEILPYDTLDDITSGAWWVAYVDGTPVGFCAIRRSSRWSNTGYLCRAGVRPKFRGQGVQKKLIRVRERYAKKIGWNWLISDTFENAASANSLISCGFKMYIPSRKYGADGTCYWRKKL